MTRRAEMDLARDRAARRLVEWGIRLVQDARDDLPPSEAEAAAVVDAIVEAARAPESAHTRAVEALDQDPRR
jgi:hypothetical protein